MWNPAGAIIQLIQTAWNVYCWIKENAQRIFGLVQAVVDSISNIVAGNIGGAANWIEASLAKLVPVAISLFANLLGLGGIADKLKSIIEKIQTKVDQAIDKLIDRVMGMFKGKGDKDDEKSDGQDVPKSLTEPQPVELDSANETLAGELAGAKPGQIIFQKADGDPKSTTKQLLAEHPDAAFDPASGRLTLPPLEPDAMTGAASLAELGARVAQQTGVAKVTLDVDVEGVALRGHINPDTPLSKKKLAPKKRGDHVFAHALTKLPAELRDVASEMELIGSKASVDSAISVIGSNVTHAAFKLTVDKPPTGDAGGDPQSQAFGTALQAFRPTFKKFLDDLAMLDLAVATEASATDRAAAVTAANTALNALRTGWTSLLDTAHDQECTPLLDKAGKALEQEGLRILGELKTKFPQPLASAVSADSSAKSPDAKPSASATTEPKAEGS